MFFLFVVCGLFIYRTVAGVTSRHIFFLFMVIALNAWLCAGPSGYTKNAIARGMVVTLGVGRLGCGNAAAR